jgi:hypothetical protein
MIYSLILVLSTGVTTVGTYNTLGSCQAQLQQFQNQKVVAACVQQESPEQQMARAQAMFSQFLKIIPKE